MPRIKETTVYSFDELSDNAKKEAREWFRQDYPSSDWWDLVFDDASNIASAFGLTIAGTKETTRYGRPYNSPDIRFSGFWSQGDGASYVGTYEFKADALEAVKAIAPTDEKLHDIIVALMAAQADASNRINYNVTQSGNYEHSNTMQFELCDHDSDGNELDLHGITLDMECAVIRPLRAFADWIYRSLETEHDWLCSDEQVDVFIRVNEYEFNEHGGIE